MTLEEAIQVAVAHHQAGRLAEAETIYRQVLVHQPNHPVALHLLGVLAGQAGHPDVAEEMIRRAIAVCPTEGSFYSNLGKFLKDGGRTEEAIAVCRQAVMLAPQLPDARINLAQALAAKGAWEEAEEAYRAAAVLLPEAPMPHFELGHALDVQGRLDEAAAAYEEAVRLKPDYVEALNNLGNMHKDRGDLDAAIACCRRAVALRPDRPDLLSNLLYLRPFHPGYGGSEIRVELQAWEERFGAPVRSSSPNAARESHKDGERRLRIGYVSPNFREHVVGFNMLPLLREHDHDFVEVFCYSNDPREDQITAQLKEYADHWRMIAGESDTAVAERIRTDGIDILVDLALHMAGNRLSVFALKPAPVQVTFAGYPGSTGLRAIDYRLTDRHLDPGGAQDQDYSEESIRLPETFWCYDPMEAEIPVQSIPAKANGPITFGCLNNFCKVNPGVASLWGRVMRAVKDSHLLVMAPAGEARQRLLGWLGAAGITADRIEFTVKCGRREYLQHYHRIDIGLDTWPYNGHTTSLDAFWMGVPVVTFVGSTVVGRAGLSQLTNLGLPELIARTEEEYVSIAAGLTEDRPRLAALRTGLRERMKASSLMNAGRFARNIEAAYREIWGRRV